MNEPHDAMSSNSPQTPSDTHLAYLARQPILNTQLQIVAFELLYRSGTQNIGPGPSVQNATATVMLHALGVIGLSSIASGRPVYINFDDANLLADLPELLPPDKVVLEILETAKPTTQLLERCKEWLGIGYRLALDDFIYRPEWEPFLKIVQIVKLDVRALGLDTFAAHVKMMKSHGLSVLAEKVESQEEYETCLKLGCDLFQGYFFARPEIISETKLPVVTTTLLEALRRIRQDSDTRELEHTISRDAAVLYRILRYAASIGFGAGKAPQTLTAAIMRLGRRNLQRWLTLELYASAHDINIAAGSLLDLANYRAELMSILASEIGLHHEEIDEAGAVGCLSLLDALFKRPMDKVIDGLALPSMITDALIHETGPLGQILSLTRALEQEESHTIARLCVQIGINETSLPELQAKALENQAKFSENY